MTHRVVEITTLDEETGGSNAGERMFRTKGDANDEVDAWKMVLDGPDQARVAHHIPYVGYFYMALQVRWVQLLVIVIPAIALVVYIVVTMWRVSGDAVKEERAQAGVDDAVDADDEEDDKGGVPT